MPQGPIPVPDERAHAGPIAAMALAAIRREYPSHVTHLLRDDADARPPRELTPAFFGSFDWHSAVHGHWCLARLARRHPDAAFAAAARAALAESLTPTNLGREAAYMSAEGREGFERPYGLAWLLQLAAELREWEDTEARRWSAALAPLETLAAQRLGAWLARLAWPVRAGVHHQTAFAAGLMLDWARTVRDAEAEARIAERARAWFGADVAAPIVYEPSGHDFLSPVLGEADLLRRVLARDAFALWLARFLPDLESAAARRWLTPVTSPDRADGHFAHLDGLNLSRAWMLEGVASALSPAEARRAPLLAAAARHRAAGLAALGGLHYAGSHWLGSFAAYLVTGRGLPESEAAGPPDSAAPEAARNSAGKRVSK
jgi:hypothetical protein